MRNKTLVALLSALGSLVAATGAQAAWSGYVLTGNAQSFLAVSATWIQPTVSCPTPNARVSMWVGIDGFGSPTVEQAGTVVVCTRGKPSYKAFSEMFGVPKQPFGCVVTGSWTCSEAQFDISPGDTITASVTYNPPLTQLKQKLGVYWLSVTDESSGSTFTRLQTCKLAACYRLTAEWIVETPAKGKYALADFGTVWFTQRAWLTTPDQDQFVTGKLIRIVDKKTHTVLSSCSFTASFFPGDLSCTWQAAQGQVVPRRFPPGIVALPQW